MAKAKKIDIKKLVKVDTMNQIQELFESQGFEVINGTNFHNMTDTTIVVRLDDCDVQIKLVTPSAKNGNRYEEETE